jgi:small-conductance mechanosensitive channel
MENAFRQVERFQELAAGLPAFALPLGKVILAILLAVLLHSLAVKALRRTFGSREDLARSLLERSRRPLRLAFVFLGLILVLPTVALPHGWETGLRHLAQIVFITLVGWTAIVLVNHFTDRAVRRHSFDAEDNLMARKFVTQVRVLRRTAIIVLGILTVSIVLLTFQGVRQYGVSLFASAGAAGLVLGLAARPVLTNLIAGVQIALTQPIRLDDVVIVEDEWGWVEEIFATYVVVRLWDWRRMVVPLSYFIEKPFQNWTRETASIIGAVTWNLDYTVPVPDVRRKLEELVAASGHWDGRVVNLQVTETDKDTITLRGLMSARTAPQAWDLRCEVREKMIGWLQETHPDALPRLRGQMSLDQADKREAA